MISRQYWLVSHPVATMRNYQQEVHSYTKGTGRIICSLKGYYPCHNEEEVLENSWYDPDADIANPSASYFAAMEAVLLCHGMK